MCPRFEKITIDLDISASFWLEEAAIQSMQIGAVNNSLRSRPADVALTTDVSIHEALGQHVNGANVRLPGAR